MKTKVTKDGFVWLIVDKFTAQAIWNNGNEDLYILYNDDSEGLIEDVEKLHQAIDDNLQIGLEVGFVKDLLPRCPKCESRLIPSRNCAYDWECLECDENFTENEI